MFIFVRAWRWFRKILLPDGSVGERVYYRLRLSLVIIRTVGLRQYLNNKKFLFQLYSLPGKSGDYQRINHLAYQKWILKTEPSAADLAEQRLKARLADEQPVISIITPVYNPPLDVFQDTLDSVLQQTYACWEWCLANASDNPEIVQFISTLPIKDARIKIKHLEKNLGIAANTNAALKLAGGDFVLMLDHDDLLAPDALFQIFNAIRENSEAELIYYDEDKISADRKIREEPWFKPPIASPALLFSSNFWMHSAIRKSLLDKIGPLDSTVDGAQDWDLAFKLLEANVKSVHIPRVLYHWRRVAGSVASDANAKPWAFTSQKRCIENALLRSGSPDAKVSFPDLGVVRIHWPLQNKKVSLIIPSRNNVEKLKPCIDAILHLTRYPDFEIIVVDNGSTDLATLIYYKSLPPEIKLLSYPFAFNYHRINNQAARFARGEHLVFLNDDTEPLSADWLAELAGWLEQPGVGIVGARLVRPEGTTQHGGIIIGLAGHGSHLFDGVKAPVYGPNGSTEWYRDVMAVTGACLAIRRTLFDDLGGFDEIYKVGYGDIDLCLRAVAAGKRVIYTPFARLIHHEGSSRGLNLPISDVLRASLKMYSLVMKGDPFFNQNLSVWNRIPTVVSTYETSRDFFLLKVLQDFDIVSPVSPTIQSLKKWGADLSTSPWPPSKRKSPGRILIVSHELSLTGAPLVVFDLAVSLKQHGYQIHVVSPYDGPLKKSFAAHGIEVEVFTHLAEDPRLIQKQLAESDYAIVNTLPMWRSVHAARAFGIPALWIIHEAQAGLRQVERIPALRRAFESASMVVFPSRHTAALYSAYLDPEKSKALHFGTVLPKTNLQNCKVVEDRLDGILNLVNIASIEHRKGQDLLIEGYMQLPQNLKNKVHITLVGRALTKSEPDFCKKILRQVKNIPNLEYLGERTRAETIKLLNEADGLIITSRDEALPLSIMEAMALGKTIIATAVGGIPEVIQDGKNGLLIKENSPEAIAKAIQKLDNPEFRKELQKQARLDYSEKLNFSKFVQEIEQILNSDQESGEVRTFAKTFNETN